MSEAALGCIPLLCKHCRWLIKLMTLPTSVSPKYIFTHAPYELKWSAINTSGGGATIVLVVDLFERGQ